jgi:hypothetical protein
MKLIMSLFMLFVVLNAVSCGKQEEEPKSNNGSPFPTVKADCGGDSCM